MRDDCPRCQRGEHSEPWWCEEHRQRHGTCHKHGGQPCHGSLAPGLSTCRMHGGAGSDRKILAGKALARRPGSVGHWQPIKIHPAEALLQEVWYHTGLCAWLDSVVAGLERGEMTWGLTKRRVASGSDGAEETAEWAAVVNTWVSWAERAHRDKAQVARWAMEGMAEDSMVRVAEILGAKAAGAFERGLARLELTPHQWELARQVYPEVLAELAA